MRTSHLAAAALLMAGTTSAIAQAPPTAPNGNPAGRPNARNRTAQNAPRVSGEITKVAGRVFSVKTLRGETVMVTVAPETPVMKPDRAAGAIADLKVGTHINATGERPTPTTLTARRVMITNPMATGTIQTVSATGITLRLPDGKTATYTVDSKTRWMRNRAASPWTNFKGGERVVVEYTGKIATIVRLAPAQRAPGQRRGVGARRGARGAAARTAPNGPSSGPRPAPADDDSEE